MILLLDNYDSFTYNLAQYLGEFGCNVEVHRNDKISVEHIAQRKPEAIIISPGPCTPQEAGVSVELVQKLAGKFPILGVCLGHQAIGAAFGGKIIRAPKLFHGKTSEIHHDGKGIFKKLPEPFTATRYSANPFRANYPSRRRRATASSWASATAATNSKASSFTPNRFLPRPARNSSRISCPCKYPIGGSTNSVSHEVG